MYYLSFAWFLLNVDSRCIRTIHWVDYFISCVIYTLLMTILIHMTIVTLAMSQLCDEQCRDRLMNYAEKNKTRIKHELYTVSNSVRWFEFVVSWSYRIAVGYYHDRTHRSCHRIAVDYYRTRSKQTKTLRLVKIRSKSFSKQLPVKLSKNKRSMI